MGSLVIFLGLVIGNSLGYAAGRLLPTGQQRGNHISGGRVGWLTVLLTRPVPVLAEAVTLIAGSRMSLPRFLIAACLGNAVYAAGLSAIGARWLAEGDFALFVGASLVVPGMLYLVGAQFVRRKSRRLSP